MDILELYKDKYNEPDEEKVKKVIHDDLQQEYNNVACSLFDKSNTTPKEKSELGAEIIKALQEAIDEAKAEKQQKQGLKKRRNKHV